MVNKVNQVGLRMWNQWKALNTRLRNLAFLFFTGLVRRGQSERSSIDISQHVRFDADEHLPTQSRKYRSDATGIVTCKPQESLKDITYQENIGSVKGQPQN